MENWKDFIKAGKAIFTLSNDATGNRFTYKVKKHSEKDLWFVSVLSGSDNNTDYRYLGTIFGKTFRLTKNSKITAEAKSFKAFNWLNNKIFNNNMELPEGVHVHHEGLCGRCGRRLTVPESIESGFGPECINKI